MLAFIFLLPLAGGAFARLSLFVFYLNHGRRLTRGAISGKNKVNEVELELRFLPPHPFCCNMPEHYSIRGKSVTEVYFKLVRFFRRSGFEFGR